MYFYYSFILDTTHMVKKSALFSNLDDKTSVWDIDTFYITLQVIDMHFF